LAGVAGWGWRTGGPIAWWTWWTCVGHVGQRRYMGQERYVGLVNGAGELRVWWA